MGIADFHLDRCGDTIYVNMKKAAIRRIAILALIITTLAALAAAYPKGLF